ncbi:sigma-70 family RNA polymerase sigma factor [Flavobacteriaceae bacterium TP-CH-4]|uniref:Sigma-70 family RNA polymerase sigma factor n=1 Tax=Pelagihabitans pacificus TaxID=2696054 RepID=A0A967ATI4_9FLAO|nr:sigma-70 family RNA polymerase sigma factor [Pelagihabitans pacificus]NHF59739.1 sigma-70 family RNA polymerase sigma factor [Pelagihabitans pacificus]
MPTKELFKHKQENDFQQFYKKLETFVPELKQFMTGSLKAAEQQGMLDRGFYDADEMLDEVYLEVFNDFSSETDIVKLRRSLFQKALKKIEGKEAEEIPDEVNTHAMLKGELKLLNEDFTTDGDGDPILYDELDDISYRQKQGWSSKIYLDDLLEKQLIAKFDLHEASLLSDEKRQLLGVLYNTIPERSKKVIELFVFGNQDTHEISEILGVPEEVIERIFFKVKERFKLV